MLPAFVEVGMIDCVIYIEDVLLFSWLIRGCVKSGWSATSLINTCFHAAIFRVVAHCCKLKIGKELLVEMYGDDESFPLPSDVSTGPTVHERGKVPIYIPDH